VQPLLPRLLPPEDRGQQATETILSELETLERNQEVQTVSVAGGEPTLHPELVDIVRMIHNRGHSVSLVTNGILLTDDLLGKLRTAGLDIVMIHVDEGQQRPDLPPSPTVADINSLRRQIARRVAAHGMDAGLCVTIYREHFYNLKGLFECLVASPEINFVFATHAVEIDDLVAHSRIASSGLRPGGYRSAPTRNSDVIAFFEEQFHIRPYACIPARRPDGQKSPASVITSPFFTGRRIRSAPSIPAGRTRA